MVQELSETTALIAQAENARIMMAFLVFIVVPFSIRYGVLVWY